MKKKVYIKPEMEIVNCESQTSLLAGSGENPYWIEPDEPEEGCQSNWWCGK
ncbi:MAG: hypothetical protein J6V44_06365 [Methanobrevibacter sp.]|nr:hypothetical protein [Methanobrevibacter sp.]